jgi:two-component system, LytTR family, response regulator
MISTLIIDDEIRSIENLEQLLNKYCPDVQVLNTCSNIQTAYESILALKPDLIFLDVDMSPDTGFDLIRRFDHLPCAVIFVTAFSHYAIDAIKFSALYYILKPIRIDDLKDAILKAKDKISTGEHTDSRMVRQILQAPHDIRRIVLNSHSGADILNFSDIVYIRADNVYSVFYLADSRTITSTKGIKEYELMLQHKGFFRVHKSYIVNLDYVRSVDKYGDEVVLKNQKRIPLAMRRKDDFMKLL